ncbi:MAG: hypothetical protein KAI70_00360 [Candidatus Omnitrophica bacterium]|nr:hypothetical protein [Candidatus Omnitrophota bacterium]
MEDRKQINVRIPTRLHEQIAKMGQAKQDVVTAALELYFTTDTKPENSKTIVALVNELDEKNKQISELHIMVQSAISRHAIEAPSGRPWWKFW